MSLPNTREIDLYMPAASGFGLYAGSASIEVDPINGRMIGLTAVVEKGVGRKALGREINCLADSDTLPFDDKPIAAHIQGLATQWLAGDEGQSWVASLVLTRAERREMALEHAFDLAREAV